MTNDPVDVQSQHAALKPLCSLVFEEPASRRRVIGNRPVLQAALDALGPKDVLAVKKVSHLAQSMVDGMEVLTDLFERGVVVKVLEGALGGGHADPSFTLDQCREITRLRRQLRRAHIQEGIEAAQVRGVVHGRPTVVDADKRAAILSCRESGESLRSISQAVGLSVGTVHNVLADP